MMQVRYFLFSFLLIIPLHLVIGFRPQPPGRPPPHSDPKTRRGLRLTSFGYVVGVVSADSCRER